MTSIGGGEATEPGGEPATGIGDGVLSAEARARLARPATTALRPPPADDTEAVSAWRADVHRAWLEGDPPPQERGHREDEIGGVRCLVAGAGDGRGPVVVYAHGGGYALGSPEVAVPITEGLVAAGLDLVSVDYRLAPEHPFPAGLDDVVAVHRTVARSGRPVVLAGDSAGANLVVSAALAERSARTSGAVALVLLSPHLDHGPAGGGGDAEVDGPRGGRHRHRRHDVDDEAAQWLRTAYCGGRRPDDPAVSPLRTPLSRLGRLPPLLIQVGTDDLSFDHGVRLARRVRTAGVAVDLDVWVGMWHTWHYHRELPEAARALASAAAFARRLAAPAS